MCVCVKHIYLSYYSAKTTRGGYKAVVPSEDMAPLGDQRPGYVPEARLQPYTELQGRGRGCRETCRVRRLQKRQHDQGQP